MSDWAEAFEQRSVDDLLEQLQEDLRDMWDRESNPHILGLVIIAEQLGKKLTEEREQLRRGDSLWPDGP